MTVGSAFKRSQIESLIAWWSMAGVDDYCADEAVDWLRAPPQPPRLSPTPEPFSPAGGPTVSPPATSPRAAASLPPIPVGPAPTSLDQLHERLAREGDLPGTVYGQARARPVGAAEAPLMIISDCPDDDDLAAGTILTGRTGTLLRNMLSAIGIDLAACYRASLAVSRPPSGRLSAADIAPLAIAMRQHIMLARPQNLLLLGTGASEALTGDPVMKARAALHDFNQAGRTMALVATYHPRTLLTRPHCKRQAWEDLQLLLKEGSW